MNPIAWLRWRSRVPGLKGSPVAQMAEVVAWREAKHLYGWRDLLPALQLSEYPERRFRLWVVNAALWQRSRLTRRVSVDLLDQFFTAFWPVFLREATADTSVPMTAEQLSEHVALFLPTIADPPGWDGQNDKYVLSLGAAAWVHIEGSEPPRDPMVSYALAMVFSNKLFSCAELLDTLPSIRGAPSR